MMGVGVVSVFETEQTGLKLSARHFEAGNTGGIGLKRQSNQLIEYGDILTKFLFAGSSMEGLGFSMDCHFSR